MATKAPAAPLISEQLTELLGLIKGADSVELKVTVPETAHISTARALGMDPLEAEIRQVYFFDTPDLALNERGVVVRGRRVQRKGDDTVVKLRPVVPSELPPNFRKSPNLGIEVDTMPGGFVCSASMKGALAKPDVKKVAEGKRALSKIFSKDQKDFYAAHAPDGLALDDLVLLGPIFVLKLRFRPVELAQKVVAELWMYPDNTRILELSTKCLPADALQVSIDTKQYLASKGVDLTGDQQTKTTTALDYFSQNLAAPASA